jgi:hypothetical protein
MKASSPPGLQELVGAVGGYDKITAEQWTTFDRAMAEYPRERRELKFDDKADLALAILAISWRPEQAWPYRRCLDCGHEARFGYRVDGELRWWCGEHRLAKNYADARR